MDSYLVDNHLSYPYFTTSLPDIAGLYFARFTNDFRCGVVARHVSQWGAPVMWTALFSLVFLIAGLFERIRRNLVSSLPHTLGALSATLPLIPLKFWQRTCALMVRWRAAPEALRKLRSAWGCWCSITLADRLNAFSNRSAKSPPFTVAVTASFGNSKGKASIAARIRTDNGIAGLR